MKKRYAVDSETLESGAKVPVVTDARMPRSFSSDGSKVICWCVSVSAAKRIASALNEQMQRRLDLK